MLSPAITVTRQHRDVPAETRGRSNIYNLGALEVGEGYDFKVAKSRIDLVRNLRGGLYASASHFGLKIKTRFDRQQSMLSVWRIT